MTVCLYLCLDNMHLRLWGITVRYYPSWQQNWSSSQRLFFQQHHDHRCGLTSNIPRRLNFVCRDLISSTIDLATNQKVHCQQQNYISSSQHIHKPDDFTLVVCCTLGLLLLQNPQIRFLNGNLITFINANAFTGLVNLVALFAEYFDDWCLLSELFFPRSLASNLLTIIMPGTFAPMKSLGFLFVWIYACFVWLQLQDAECQFIHLASLCIHHRPSSSAEPVSTFGRSLLHLISYFQCDQQLLEFGTNCSRSFQCHHLTEDLVRFSTAHIIQER